MRRKKSSRGWETPDGARRCDGIIRRAILPIRTLPAHRIGDIPNRPAAYTVDRGPCGSGLGLRPHGPQYGVRYRVCVKTPRALPCMLAVATALMMVPVAAAQTAPSNSAAPSDVLRPIEQTFLVEGIELSRHAAEVSRLAVSQGTSTDVRTIAQQLVADHAQIAGSLDALARRKAVALPISPTSFSTNYRELATQPITAFDRAFILDMAASSEQSLRLCERALAGGKDADVRALAGSLLPVLRDHVNKFTELQKSL